jgi:hypothetical protein
VAARLLSRILSPVEIIPQVFDRQRILGNDPPFFSGLAVSLFEKI